jgi:phosphopantetheinyl transferase
MSLENIFVEQNRAWGIWRIDENEEMLAGEIAPVEQISETITHVNKRLEWLAGRVLVKRLLISMQLPFQGITKDLFGKPFPKGYPYYLSLSHSYPYVAALVDKNIAVGIDLEQPKHKLLKIAPRIFTTREQIDAGNDVVKHCIYWCAKEALIKVYGQKDLVFAENLIIEPFELQASGNLSGRIVVGDSKRVIPLRYIVYPNFVLVFNQQS